MLPFPSIKTEITTKYLLWNYIKYTFVLISNIYLKYKGQIQNIYILNSQVYLNKLGSVFIIKMQVQIFRNKMQIHALFKITMKTLYKDTTNFMYMRRIHFYCILFLLLNVQWKFLHLVNSKRHVKLYLKWLNLSSLNGLQVFSKDRLLLHKLPSNLSKW